MYRGGTMRALISVGCRPLRRKYRHTAVCGTPMHRQSVWLAQQGTRHKQSGVDGKCDSQIRTSGALGRLLRTPACYRPAIAARGPPRIACERDSNRRETLCNSTKPGPGGALALTCPGGSGGTWGINADQLEARTVERIREAKAARKTGSTRMY